MKSQSSPFLTIAMEVAASQSDPLDSPGASKLLMIQAADELVDGALARMPGYLEALPQEVRPTVEELRQAFRRAYRLNGPRLEMDLSVVPSALPSAWVESLAGAEEESGDIPWVIVWTARLVGWWVGLGKDDRQKVAREAHDKTRLQQREKIKIDICHGMMRLTGAAVETELFNKRTSLMVGGPLRAITIRWAT